MMEALSEAPREPQRDAPRIAQVEGYLASSIMVILAFDMFVAPLLRRIPEPYGLAIYMTAEACGWLFAISGARRGRGGARLAARVSLAFFALRAGLILIVALIQSLRSGA